MSELDDLVRQRRFDEIHEARRQVIEDERSINEALATGRVDDGRARRLFQRAVDAYVRELEYLLNPPDSDEENEYWHTAEIGEIQKPDGTVREVSGLGEYLDLPEQLVVQIRETQRDHYYQVGQHQTRNVGVQPPWSVLRSAFRTANAAITDLGLELDVDDSSGDVWEFREINDVDDLDPEDWGDLSLGNGHASDNGGADV
jgi:hypothetical protein